MVPTFVLFGFLASVMRRGWVLIALTSAAFVIYLPFGDRFSDSGNALGFSLLGGLLALVNCTLGFGVGRAMKWALARAANG